jgi:Flp pilus assembly protein TadG
MTEPAQPCSGTKHEGKRVRGQSLIEFSLVCLMLYVAILGVVETGRLVLVCATVANAARAGARYAIVHGGSRVAGSGSSNASGPASNPAQVVNVVDNFAGAGLLTIGRLVVSVTYPNASNAPGQPVTVSVVYPYDPLASCVPFEVRLGSTSQGVIVY